MNLGAAVAIVPAVVAAGGAGFLATKVPIVWRGTVPPVIARMMEELSRGRKLVSRRSYALFALEVNLLTSAWLLNVVGRAAGALPVEQAAKVLILPVVVATLLHLTIYACTWPRLLVPPDLRNRPGAVARARERRRRLAAGLPPTSHHVVVYDMRPRDDNPDPFPPQFVAACGDEDCGWTSEPLYQDEPDAEAQVRREARTHSDQVAVGTRGVSG